MSRPRGTDRFVQDFLDGRIDEEELRSAFAEAGEAGALEGELTAYREVWETLRREPTSTLPPDFARRVARRAARERETFRAADLRELLAGVSLGAAVAASLAGATILLSLAGIDPGGVVQSIRGALASVPGPLWGTAGAGLVLYALDRLVLGSLRPTALSR